MLTSECIVLEKAPKDNPQSRQLTFSCFLWAYLLGLHRLEPLPCSMACLPEILALQCGGCQNQRKESAFTCYPISLNEDDDNTYFLSAYCEPGTAVSALHALFYLIPTTTTILGLVHNDCSFIDDENETQRDEGDCSR